MSRALLLSVLLFLAALAARVHPQRHPAGDHGQPERPAHEAERLGAKFPLVSVKGGKAPESGPCDPFAPHGFFGREAETVDAIAGWMLDKPYRKDID